MNSRLLFLHALSPLHAGVGQGVGVIDLPIAREKSTGIPYLPGSSIKGVLRAACEDKGVRIKVFGPETENASDHAGAAQFSDLTLLCLPVRSLYGTFAWVTSSYLLRRFSRDLKSLGQKSPATVPQPQGESSLVAPQSSVVGKESKVILEDLDIPAKPNDDVKNWGQWLGNHIFEDGSDWKEPFVRQLVVVADDIMSFLLETATEVVARIALKEQEKTVKEGALWYEESLPTESILWGVTVATPVKVNGTVVNSDTIFKTLEALVQSPLQVGGHASVGRGVCQARMVAL